MKYQKFFTKALLGLILLLSPSVHGATLDWEGYFRADFNYLNNYSNTDSAPNTNNEDNTDTTDPGESVANEGSSSTSFFTLFAKLKPSLLINDNIIFRSEWNLGDPLLSFWGDNTGNRVWESRNPNTTLKGSLPLRAARLWLDFHTNFGLVQVGRAPMDWGLGIVFHSGDRPMDRFQSTSDTIRFISKFGYLAIMPFYSKVGLRTNIDGSRIGNGSDDVTDYGIALKFHNPEEELEAGILFSNRRGDSSQTTFAHPDNSTPSNSETETLPSSEALSLTLFDLYLKKTWHRITVQAELPIYFGKIPWGTDAGFSTNEYSATGFAGEVSFNLEEWKHTVRLGMAPGSASDNYTALYFHPNYKLGQILFRYNFGGFGDSSSYGPYDTSIVNAQYIMVATENKGDQWSWNGGIIWAQAAQAAESGKRFFNHRTQTLSSNNAAGDQSSALGLEFALGGNYAWDENINIRTDAGLFFPGSFFDFAGSAVGENATGTMFALSLSLHTFF